MDATNGDDPFPNGKVPFVASSEKKIICNRGSARLARNNRSFDTPRTHNSFFHSDSTRIKNANNLSEWRDFIKFREANGSVGGIGNFTDFRSGADNLNYLRPVRTAAPFRSSNSAAINVAHSMTPSISESFNNGNAFPSEVNTDIRTKLIVKDAGGFCKISGCTHLCGPLRFYPADLQRKVLTGELNYPKRCVHHINSSRLPAFLQAATATFSASAAAAADSRVARSSAALPSDLHDAASCRLACVEALVKKTSDTCALHTAQFRCQVAACAALPGQVSSLQTEFEALKADLASLLEIVLSQGRSIEANAMAADTVFETTLRGSLGTSANAVERTATGIIRVPSSRSVPIFRTNRLDSVTEKVFSGCCFTQRAPPRDGWWYIGTDEWLYSRPADFNWWSQKDTELYQLLIPYVLACENLRSYHSLRGIHSGRDLDNMNGRELELQNLKSRIACRATDPFPESSHSPATNPASSPSLPSPRKTNSLLKISLSAGTAIGTIGVPP